jgi:LmbE family N-acetylglucosaminyl deacetylase
VAARVPQQAGDAGDGRRGELSDSAAGSIFAEGEIAVLSPHLDDAALSLGAAIAHASRRGATVRVVTVFAYDPSQTGPPQSWDAACGFHSAEEAARSRRDEDSRASEILGAEPVWLPFTDIEYAGERNEEAIWSAIDKAVGEADVVLVPGFPLAVPDHGWLTSLMLRRPPRSGRVALYVEQPYAAWRYMSLGGRAGAATLSRREGVLNALRIALRTRAGRRLQEPALPDDLERLLGSPPNWTAASVTRTDRRAKFRAIKAYESQVAGFGPLVTQRMALYEAAWGGEGVAWANVIA